MYETHPHIQDIDIFMQLIHIWRVYKNISMKKARSASVRRASPFVWM
ncbi:hypothetical protein HMPREF1147_0891 [Selenomonas sp. FOBRC9]|nr:hypothetical protein HMPREF1147_0891 [Selenomonas sp. FOBRC9]